jgi:DNA polymerase I-like protein with 3'-5' exonuclease and polymerase domains
MIKVISTLSLFDEFEQATKEEIVSYCLSKKVIGIDIETTRKYPRNAYSEKKYQAGLDPYLSNIIMLQIGDDEKGFVIDARHCDLSFLKSVLESPDVLKVGHNLKFEGKHLYLKGLKLVNIWDTMICEKVLYNGMPYKYSLASLVERYFNVKLKNTVETYDLFEEVDDELETTYIDKSIRLQFIDWGDKAFTKDQIEYGYDDVLYPLKIYKIQKEGRILQDGTLYNPVKGFELENKITQVLAKMELRGINVDIEGWMQLYEKNKKIYLQYIDKLNKWVIENHPKFRSPPNLFDKNWKCSIQWTSSKQVVEFAKYLNICPKEVSKQTKKLEYTVGAKSMVRLLENENKDRFMSMQDLPLIEKYDYQSFILNYLITKKYEQLISTFGKDWLSFIHPITGKVHTNFVQLMNTGRLSSTSPNIQQIPNGKEWRKLFIAPKGYKLIATDYSAQEVRVAAEVTNCKELQDFFVKEHPIFKDDFHSFTATQMFKVMRKDDSLILNKKDNKKERNIAKGMVFKINYGGSPYTISQDMGISIEEAELFYNSFLNGFKGLKENFEITKKLAVKRGWIELDSYTGKKYFYPFFDEMKELQQKAMSYYPENYRDFSKQEKKQFKANLYSKHPEVKLLWKQWGILKGKLERAALNYRIQGLSATMSKLAMGIIDYQNDSLDEGLLLFVHDEAVELYKEENIEEKITNTISSMKKSGLYVCKKVPMDAEAAVGDFWVH